ncbi:hypothetical protein GCM10008957_53780 [Deinococcus ruber]|uniref:Uncharacterized protein n=1 Tax=Deinococcus ruber TaxID=1848197 RepID=A0A918KWW1_9DEIO|nr:hypothetical protein GCM10008957_53780 [Deinococcus ruber]
MITMHLTKFYKFVTFSTLLLLFGSAKAIFRGDSLECILQPEINLIDVASIDSVQDNENGDNYTYLFTDGKISRINVYIGKSSEIQK